MAKMSPSTGTETSTATSPVTARHPHLGDTPPSSPLPGPAVAILNDPEPVPVPRQRTTHPLTAPGSPSGSGWLWGWSSPRSASGSNSGKGKKGKGHSRTLSREENDHPDRGASAASEGRKKKRTLSNQVREAGGGMVDLLRTGIGAGREGEMRKSRVGAVGRAVGLRVNGIRKGNLPFAIVFIVCVFVFFSALAGIGYIPPPDAPNPAVVDFELGRPVFDLHDEVHGQQIMAARRKMEESWERKKRPKDGAWMKKVREDGAVRRKAKSAPKPKGEERPAPIDPKIRGEAEQEGDQTV